MSTQKGNMQRCRAQKYQNRTSFKNNLNDTSHRTKFINNIQVAKVCQRCKEIIEWKIKYKKYKPLTQPKKCVKCEQRTVRHAYHVMCIDCGNKLKVCTKCGEAKDVIEGATNTKEQIQLDVEMQDLLKSLSERKRRTFIRHMNKQVKENDAELQDNRAKLIDKLNLLKVADDDFDGLSDFDDLSD